ncbi:MAG: thioredoxin domain-containing protein [Chloroflexi bacterium]|nr:thioredoxin domain-containing protein [Chloroflexota bacterium]
MERPSTRLGAMSIAMLLLLALAGTALAQGPSPVATTGPGTTQPAATEVPLPDLTMAPLVTLPPVRPANVVRDVPTDGQSLGAADAPVVIEVYEDFQCPYCQRFTFLVEPDLVETWVRPGHARLVFRDFAFLGEESRWAAVAARLAAEQDRFWPFHDLLFANLLGENVGSYTPDRLLLMGRMAGLDMEPFIEGLQVPAARERWAAIEADVRNANATRGVNATPTVFVNGVRVASPDLQTIDAAIRAALAGSGGPSDQGPGASAAPAPAP